MAAISLGLSHVNWAQSLTEHEIRERILQYKSDPRGPYKDIRWFCKDGSIRQPKDPCPEAIGPGVQHARYKDEVVKLADENHIYLGQILTATKPSELWNQENHFSRLKQYQLGRYLQSVDDGWILRKAQFYRGAIQAEDEQSWGLNFYKQLLKNDEAVEKHFFLLRQSMKDIPYSGDENLGQLMRSQSKIISDAYLPFMDLRIKIHGSPSEADIEKVVQFQRSQSSRLNGDLNRQLNELVQTMRAYYKPIELKTLISKSKLWSDTTIGDKLKSFIKTYETIESPEAFIIDASELLFDLRKAIEEDASNAYRLEMLDISLKIETLIFRIAPQWEALDLHALMNKICYLGMANTGAGLLEFHEWDELNFNLEALNTQAMSLADLNRFLENARSMVEWSVAMVKAYYQEEVDRYVRFEPLAYGFIDDRIRSSILLYLGRMVGDLGDIIAREDALVNKVFQLTNQSSFRGLNPGYAMGELVVIDGYVEELAVDSDKIYVFQKPPSDLKPVAGIATVSEGNLVSHVQLLARNLGIPNSALSDSNLNDLKAYQGRKVFYAVSNKGNVIMKLADEMNEDERKLFEKKERSEDRISVPVGEIRLSETAVLNMRDVDARDSGKSCGPKAANLGQLKKMFPENVVEGLVIPFGIFKKHMDLPMPGYDGSYWDFLNAMFKEADKMRSEAKAEKEVEAFQLEKLEILRNAIKNITLDPSFTSEFSSEFNSVFGQPLGEVPVFLRSDTNMEDLKDFTGAGLNLTLFNVVNEAKIWQGIKDVWASPYTERSFKWRQKYLLNPENVFPSILVIPSVDVDYSGVLITKGITSGDDEDLTVAFSRGAGGAVDGQLAESLLLYNRGGYRYLSPARDFDYNRLPESGGTKKEYASFESPILNPGNINDIRMMARSIEKKMSEEVHPDYEGAYDVELGFKNDKLWLFQIRPFVENKRAIGSEYLESITPKVDPKKMIKLDTKI